MSTSLKYLVLGMLFSISISVSAQDTEMPLQPIDTLLNSQSNYNALAPAKAAFYSAVLPGLGQAYNKKYWKIPIVYAGMATSMYFYFDNHKNYKEFRDIYKRRLEGFRDDRYSNYSDNVIINAQRTYQRNKNLSLLITVGIYALNIIDANVDAHLMQFNVNDNLTIKPDFRQNEIDYKYQTGLSIHYTF